MSTAGYLRCHSTPFTLDGMNAILAKLRSAPPGSRVLFPKCSARLSQWQWYHDTLRWEGVTISWGPYQRGSQAPGTMVVISEDSITPANSPEVLIPQLEALSAGHSVLLHGVNRRSRTHRLLSEKVSRPLKWEFLGVSTDNPAACVTAL